MVKLFANNLLSQCSSGKINLIMQLYYIIYEFAYFLSPIVYVCSYSFMQDSREREKSSTPVSHRCGENVAMMDKWFWRYFELRSVYSRRKIYMEKLENLLFYSRGLGEVGVLCLLLYLCFSCFPSFLNFPCFLCTPKCPLK